MNKLILPLTLLNLLNYMTRYLPAAVLPTLSHDLGFNYEQSGLVIAAFSLGYVLCTPIAGYYGDRQNRIYLMLAGVILWGLATLLLGIAPGLLVLLLARFLTGVAQAAYATLAPTYIKDLIGDPFQIGKAFSIFFVAIPVGSALGFVAGGQLSAYFAAHPLDIAFGFVGGGQQSALSGWRQAFVLCALPSIVLSFLLLRYREIPRQAAEGDFLSSVKRVLKGRLFLYCIAGYILNSFALNAVAAFTTTFGVELGFSNQSISVLFGLILVVSGFLGTYGGGLIGNYYAKQDAITDRALLKFVAFGSCLSAPLLALAFCTDNAYIFLGFAFLAELFIFAGVAPLNTLIVNASPKTDLGVAQSLCILSINLFGSFPAPWIVGYLADRYSLSSALQLAPFAVLLSAFIWWWGVKKCFDTNKTGS